VTGEIMVLDSSVGVKWVKTEPGSEEALDLLARHRDGAVTLVVADIFPIEVLDVTRRVHGRESAEALWERLEPGGPVIVPTDSAQISRIVALSRQLDCTLYDAAAPALAEVLGAQLVTADARAHRDYPGARII
jgi:predicted nucleic acid-binding protein